MAGLSIIQVLDAISREEAIQGRKGNLSGEVTYTVIVNRLLNEELSLRDASTRTEVSRYLKKALADGYLTQTFRGRSKPYKLTADGRVFLTQTRSLLDKKSKWDERMTPDLTMSFLIGPKHGPIIGENIEAEHTLIGVEEMDEVVKQFFNKNPDIQ